MSNSPLATPTGVPGSQLDPGPSTGRPQHPGLSHPHSFHHPQAACFGEVLGSDLEPEKVPQTTRGSGDQISSDQSSLGLKGQFCSLADGHHKKNQQKDPQRKKQTLSSARMPLPQAALLKRQKGRRERGKERYNALLIFSATLTPQLSDLETLESV